MKEKQVQFGPDFDSTISDKPARALVSLESVDRTAGAAGRLPAGGAGAARPPRSVLPTHRTIFVRETEWRSGTGLRIPNDEMTKLLRLLRSRDVCILLMLAQHHYLTTDQLAALFFPSATLRAARIRLRWLTEERRLLMRFRQLEPVNHGWRRRYSLFLLAERGAAVLAQCLKQDPRPLAKRSWYAAEYVLQLVHDLEVNAFFVALAAASQRRPDQGLYHWVGQDTLRQGYQEENVNLAPDGWGRYLTPSREVTFNLEWDRGTESPKRLAAKVSAYISYAAQQPSAVLDHVLWVAPGPVREHTIQSAITRAGQGGGHGVQSWTTNTTLLEAHGALGPIWQHSATAPRVCLSQLDGRPRTERAVMGCTGKPGWWDRRPGAGEGA